jgi:hypothetical protein
LQDQGFAFHGTAGDFEKIRKNIGTLGDGTYKGRHSHLQRCSSPGDRVGRSSDSDVIRQALWWAYQPRKAARTSGKVRLPWDGGWPSRREGGNIRIRWEGHRLAAGIASAAFVQAEACTPEIIGGHEKARINRAFLSNRWRPQGDSNPRRRRERAVSWASRRWGLNSGTLLVEPARIELATSTMPL